MNKPKVKTRKSRKQTGKGNSRMNPSRWLLCVIMVMTFPIVTGCWDRLEIEDRGAVLGLAIDPLPDRSDNITGPNAKSDSPGYKLTAQLAIPGRIALGPGEGTTGGASEKPVWVVRTSGKTIDDAMNNLQQELADKLFLGHLRVIIVNQKLAKTVGVQDIQDFFPNRRTKVKVRQVSGKFRCDFYSRIEANIEERTGSRRIDEVIPQVANEDTQFVLTGQNKLIKQTQAMGTDIFGIGEHVRGQFPEYWIRHIKTRDDWDRVFQRLPIHTYVKVYIRRSGMSSR